MSIELFTKKLKEFDKVLYKTLSANDYRWATDANIHQAGVLIPKDLTAFFPEVDYTQEVFTEDIKTYWMEDSKWQEYASKWKYYASKGEWRVTTVSKQPFTDVGPGSLLLAGRHRDQYYFYIADSENTEEYQLALDILELREAPKWGILEIREGRFIEEGPDLDKLLPIPPSIESLPNIAFLSQMAEDLYKKLFTSTFENEITRTPGDYIDNLINFEYKLYKRYEVKYFSNILTLRAIPEIYNLQKPVETRKFFQGKIDGFSETFMSMANSRKSRVGKTYEYHMQTYLNRLKIPYAYQEKVDGKKKPDFILPSRDFYYKDDRAPDDAILFSLKTTLKERWQQILNEGKRVERRYLATLDKAVTGDQIQEMESKKVTLVVTEWAKNNTESYKNAQNVITLKNFSEELVGLKSSRWATL